MQTFKLSCFKNKRSKLKSNFNIEQSLKTIVIYSIRGRNTRYKKHKLRLNKPLPIEKYTLYFPVNYIYHSMHHLSVYRTLRHVYRRKQEQPVFPTSQKIGVTRLCHWITRFHKSAISTFVEPRIGLVLHSFKGFLNDRNGKSRKVL